LELATYLHMGYKKELLSTSRTSQLTSWVWIHLTPLSLVGGLTCQVCSSSSEYSSVMCHENFFNADGDANNGCEATCAVLLQATVWCVLFSGVESVEISKWIYQIFIYFCGKFGHFYREFVAKMHQIYHFLQSAKWCNIFCVDLFVSSSWQIFCHWIPGQSEPSAVSTTSCSFEFIGFHV